MSSKSEEGEIPLSILEKIERGQHYISTNSDLSERGYVKNKKRSGKQEWENIEYKRRRHAISNAKRTPEAMREADHNRHRSKLGAFTIKTDPEEELMSCLSGTTEESERLVFHHVIYDYSNRQSYIIALTSSEHMQLHRGALIDENIERLQLVFKNREYIVESPEIPEEQNLNLRHPVSINIEPPKGGK